MAIVFVRPEQRLPSPGEVISWVNAVSTFSREIPDQWPEEEFLELKEPGCDSPVVIRGWETGVVRIRSSADHIAARVAYYLARESGGLVSSVEEGPYECPERWEHRLGEGFRIDEADERVRRWVRRLPEFFEINLPILRERVPGELAEITIRDDRGRVLRGRCSHPDAPLPRWIGKGFEGYTNYATDPKVPDGIFACIIANYPTQEWAFVLWSRAGRRFWFASPISGLYRHSDVRQTADDLSEAIRAWDRSDGSYFFMSGTGCLQPRGFDGSGVTLG
jgi:hypothetical protein